MTEQDSQQERQFAIDVTAKLRSAGYEAYWAGGCVRDQLLGREPKDYDVATSARPDEIRDLFGKRRTLAIGAAFGVITVLGSKAEGQIEIATFRQDVAYSDGRHPDSVRFSTAEEDAQRRDFTINGLFFDPVEEKVIDYVGGQEDLQRQVVRAIGNPAERFEEDKLRMLRAVRFAATFDFELEGATADVVQKLAGELPVVSAERIAVEMRRMLVDKHRRRAMELLRELGLLEVILPGEIELPGAEPWDQTLQCLAQLREPSFPLALSCLLLEMADEKLAKQVCSQWKLANKEIDRTLWLIGHREALAGAAESYWPDLQRVLIHDGSGELLALCSALAEVGLADRSDLDFCQERLAWPAERLNPQPLLTGDDLIAHGVPRGKIYQVLLHEVRNAQLLGEILTTEAALELVDQLRESP